MYQSPIGTVNRYISEEWTLLESSWDSIRSYVDHVYFKENVTVSAEIAFKENAADIGSIENDL